MGIVEIWYFQIWVNFGGMADLHQACGSCGINKQTSSRNSLTKGFQMRGPLWQ